MKFSCDLEKIKKALDQVGRIVDPNPTLPVLNNILLKVSGKRLTLIATNLESAIKYSFEVNIKNEGDVTTPAKVFVNYINLLTGSEVEFEKKGDDLKIKSKNSTTTIKGLPITEFPLLPEVEKKYTLNFKSKDFKKALHQTTFVCSNNTTRPVLSGVCFCYKNEEFNIVSTDGYRLSERKIEIEKKPEDSFEVIIPGKILNEVEKSVTQDDQDIECIIGENQVVFRIDGVELFSRLIKGNFPDYKVIIPSEQKTTISVKTSEILSAVRQIGVLARDNSNSLKLETGDNNIKISTNASQVGEGESNLEAKTEGDAQNINLNSEYLLAALNIFKSEEVKLILKDNKSPIIIRPQGEENFLHLIMPLKS